MDWTDGRLKRLGYVVGTVVAAGVLAMVVRSADEPTDPELGSIAPGREVGTTAPDAPGPGGDPEREPFDDFGEVALTVRRADGSFVLGCLLAALSPEQRQRGLMEVTDLQGYDGMAFLYEQDTDSGFYMRNTPMPLSIAWVGADGRLVSTADMAPCRNRADCPTYPPAGPYRLAIEVPQGGLDELGIAEGSTVTVAGECAPHM